MSGAACAKILVCGRRALGEIGGAIESTTMLQDVLTKDQKLEVIRRLDEIEEKAVELNNYIAGVGGAPLAKK
jgi:hypothetical protein